MIENTHQKITDAEYRYIKNDSEKTILIQIILIQKFDSIGRFHEQGNTRKSTTPVEERAGSRERKQLKITRSPSPDDSGLLLT